MTSKPIPPFSIRLTRKELAAAKRLAKKWKISRNGAIRQAIRQADESTKKAA